MIRPPLNEPAVKARIEQLEAEIKQLWDDLNLRNQTACDRKEIIQKLEAENRALLAQLMTARSQLEYVLATLRMTYESVRAE
jgi:cell division protein FtsB